MTTRTRARPVWRVPAALIALSFVPVLAGAFRVTELTGGARILPENAHLVASPVPVVLHIVGATGYCVLGAFQFVPSLRRRSWHRVAGRVLVLCGLTAALSGLWMTLFYPGRGELLTAFRLVFGSAMAAAIVLGFAAIRRRDFLAHRAWMIRGYAIGLGAGTQAVVIGLWVAFASQPDKPTEALLHAAAWLINLAVAERINVKEKR